MIDWYLADTENELLAQKQTRINQTRGDRNIQTTMPIHKFTESANKFQRTRRLVLAKGRTPFHPQPWTAIYPKVRILSQHQQLIDPFHPPEGQFAIEMEVF